MHEAIVAKADLMINAEQSFIEMHNHFKKQLQNLASIDDPTTRAKIDVAATTGTLCDQMRLLVMDYLKMQGQLRDSPQTQINIISIEKSNAEMEALKSAIVDILNDIDPSLLPRFFDLLKQRVEPIVESFRIKQENMLNTPSIGEEQATKAVRYRDNKTTCRTTVEGFGETSM